MSQRKTPNAGKGKSALEELLGQVRFRDVFVEMMDIVERWRDSQMVRSVMNRRLQELPSHSKELWSVLKWLPGHGTKRSIFATKGKLIVSSGK